MRMRRSLTSFIMKIAYKKIFPHTSFLYSFIRNNLSKLSENIVDLGGGAGLTHNILSDKGAKYVIIVDINYELLSEASSSSDKVLASSDEEIFRRGSVEDVVLHDALHHFDKPIEALNVYMEIVSGCIHVVDFDVEKIGGKIIRFLEKIGGFPANFYSMKKVMSILDEGGLYLHKSNGPSKFFSQYYIKACKTR